MFLDEALHRDKMWSVASIIGLATATSSILLLAGILIAIRIERRRYCKYLDRHTAGVAAGSSLESGRSVDDFENAPAQRMSNSKSTLQSSALTWVTLPSSETIDEEAQATSQRCLSDTTPTLAEKRLPSTLKGPTKKKKKRPDRRRLRRTVALRPTLNSPLSAIAETSDSSPLQPGSKISSTVSSPQQSLSKDCQGCVTEWRISIPKRRENHDHSSLMRTHSYGSIGQVIRPTRIRRSVSLTNSLASMPASPPPPLPAFNPRKSCRSLAVSHVSESSIDSVGSSLLYSVGSSPARSIAASKKRTFHALEDFVFDLESAAGSSPSKYTYSQPKTGKHELTAASKTVVFEPEVTNDNRSCNATEEVASGETMQAGTKVGKSRTKAPFIRHSVGELRKIFAAEDETVTLTKLRIKAEPISSIMQTGISSAEIRIPLQELDRQSITRRDLICASASTRAQWWQERAEAKDPTPGSLQLSTGDTRALQLQKADSMITHLPIFAGHRNVTGVSRAKLSATSLLPRNPSSVYSIKQVDGLRLAADAGNRSSLVMPTTPESGHVRPWRFDFVPIETPISRQPSPLKLHNSPILPPPILHTSNMFPYPQRSPIGGPKGPRALRNHSRSPLETKIRDYTGVRLDLSPCLSVKQATELTPVHKSVASLRHMSLEAQLLDLRGESGCDKENQRPRNESQPLASSRHKTMRAPSSSTLLKVPELAIGVKPRIASSRSPTSEAGELSIWEDISIREDSPLSSPEMELQDFLSVEDHHPLVADSSSLSEETPKAHSEDYEMYETFVRNYGTNAAIPQALNTEVLLGPANSHRNTVPSIGLGLGTGTPRNSIMLHAGVLSTPGSIYDESGFLKE